VGILKASSSSSSSSFLCFACISLSFALLCSVPQLQSILDGHVLSPPFFMQANFFRISTPRGHPKEYSAYRTSAFSPRPCFHRPNDFVTLLMDGERGVVL
jgi:hypothetical protein